MTDFIGDDDFPLEPLPVPAPGTAGDAEPVVGYLHSVETGGTVDGPGIRYVAFLQGCPLRCLYCHNPDSWQPRTGKVITPAELVADVERYRTFLRTGGLTLSGGEPLYQAPFVEEVLALCRQKGIHTALDTSGAIPLEKCRTAVDRADLIILDIKAMGEDLPRRLTGQGIHNALALLEYTTATGKDLWVRHVVVPGHTDNPADWDAMAALLEGRPNLKRFELLPFHQMAGYKWEALGRPYALKGHPVPTPELMEQARAVFRSRHIPMP